MLLTYLEVHPLLKLPSVIVGARLSVLSTSIFGTLILLGRGADCLPLIKHELYLHTPHLVWPFFNNLPTMLTIDCTWHGLPLLLVLCSRPIVSTASSPVDPLLSLLTVASVGCSFLLFERLRSINCAKTYGCGALGRSGASASRILAGIAFVAAGLFNVAKEPRQALSGFHAFFGPFVGSEGRENEGEEAYGSDDKTQILEALCAVVGWYFLVLLFGRLPGIDEEAEDFSKLVSQLLKDVSLLVKEARDLKIEASSNSKSDKQQQQQQQQQQREKSKLVEAKPRARSRSRSQPRKKGKGALV